MEIKRVAENDKIGEFINVEFSEYAADCDVVKSQVKYTFFRHKIHRFSMHYLLPVMD